MANAPRTNLYATLWSLQDALQCNAAQAQLAQEASTARACWHEDHRVPFGNAPWCWFTAQGGRLYVAVSSHAEAPCCT